MPLVLKDRVKETTTTTGTGTITLAGAVSGYQSFSVIGNANTTYYTIVDPATGSWEVGLGTYTSSGTTLSRDTVLESSNSGSLVNFGAGTKDVFVTYPAERAVVSGTTDYLSLPAPSTSGNVLTSNGSAWTSAAPSGGGATLTINNKTAAYTVISTDAGKIINCTSGTFTVSLTTAATLGSGFNCWIWNTGTGVITIDPNSTETIDGVTTITLRQGEGTQIVCDGTNWQTGDKKTMRGYAENFTANSARPMAVGTWSITLGRSYASGTEATAISVGNNTSTYGATGSNSIAIGTNAAASGQNSIAISNASSANASYATAIGQSALSTAYRGFALGAFSYAEIVGKYAYSAGNITSAGDAQRAVYLLRRNSTSATPVVLTTDAGAPSASNQIALQLYGAYAFTGMIVAARSVTAGAGAVASWKIEGLLRKGSSNGSTQLINSAVTIISNTPGWSIALSANTTDGALAITVTGAAATNIYWLASIDVTELVY